MVTEYSSDEAPESEEDLEECAETGTHGLAAAAAAEGRPWAVSMAVRMPKTVRTS